MSSQANDSSTTMHPKTHHAATTTNTTAMESPGTTPSHTTSNRTMFDPKPGSSLFIIQPFTQISPSSASDPTIHPAPTQDYTHHHHPSDEARLNHLRLAIVREDLARLCPDLPWDPHRGMTHQIRPEPASASSTVAASPLHQQESHVAPTNGVVEPKMMKVYPPYVFVPDTQRRAV